MNMVRTLLSEATEIVGYLLSGAPHFWTSCLSGNEEGARQGRSDRGTRMAVKVTTAVGAGPSGASETVCLEGLREAFILCSVHGPGLITGTAAQPPAVSQAARER